MLPVSEVDLDLLVPPRGCGDSYRPNTDAPLTVSHERITRSKWPLVDIAFGHVVDTFDTVLVGIVLMCEGRVRDFLSPPAMVFAHQRTCCGKQRERVACD